MPILNGKPGFSFSPDHFDALFRPNTPGDRAITTEGILSGIGKVDAILGERGFYQELKKSPYYVVEE